MAAYYRKIWTNMWFDREFKSLSPLPPSGQSLYIYLRTNPNTSAIPGLYRAGAAQLAEELRWTQEEFDKALQELLKAGFVKFDPNARVIYIPNALRENKPESPNVANTWGKFLDEIPQCELKDVAYQDIKAFLEGLRESFAIRFDEGIEKDFQKDMSKQTKKEKEKEKNKHIREVSTSPVVSSNKNKIADPQIKEVFTHWKTVMGHPRAKLDKSRHIKIAKALKDGYTVEQLKQAIDGCANTPFNMGENDRRQRYDGIDLIFRNADKIESFIHASQNSATNIGSAADYISKNKVFAGAI